MPRRLVGWTLVLAACSTIREVEVPATTSESSGAGETTETSTTSPAIDRDSEEATTLVLDSGSSSEAGDEATAGTQPERELHCGTAFGIGARPEGGPPLVIDADVEIADLDVTFRAQHGEADTVEVTLVRDTTSAVLLDVGAIACGPELAIRFDDDAELEAEQVCAAGLPTPWSVRPDEPLAVFTGTPLAGEWRLVVTGTPLGNGGVDAWCLSVLPAG